VKIKSLTELSHIKKELAAQTLREAEKLAQLQREELAKKKRAAQGNLFQAAVGKVQRMQLPQRASLQPAPPPPQPIQFERDEAAALQEALSDEIDITTLLDTDAQLSYRRSGVGADVTQKLRRGHWSIQGQLDLHGFRSDEAREALAGFIRNAHQQGLRCIRIVHGKGLGSPGKTPVLKEKVQRWLVQKSEVIAFVQAPPAQGGAGALVVLLQPQIRSQKEI